MAKKRISDALLGGFTGAGAGTSALGGLAQAGLIGATAANPWAWGLIGGGALIGGVSSLLAEDDVSDEERRSLQLSNQLGEQNLEMGKFNLGAAKDTQKLRRQQMGRQDMFGKSLGSMFKGAMSTPRLASGGLT